MALVILGMATYTIHGVIQQAVQTRGQAQDYTRARFLLEELVGDVEMQPELVETSQSGVFPPPDNRFRWTVEIERVDLPLPPPPRDSNGNPQRYPMPFLARVHATVSWERSARSYSESFETLYTSEKLWQPPRRPGS